MNHYKRAALRDLRFVTNKGHLSISQLNKLSIVELNSLAVTHHDKTKPAKVTFMKQTREATANELDNIALLGILADLIKGKEKAETKSKERDSALIEYNMLQETKHNKKKSQINDLKPKELTKRAKALEEKYGF